MKRLRRRKDKKKSATERKLEKDLWRFVEDNKMEEWTLLDKRGNYILQKTIRMQMEAWTLSDGGSRLYALIHEARIRRELILWSIEDDEVYIHGRSHERQYVSSSTSEEVFFEEKPGIIPGCPSKSVILWWKEVESLGHGIYKKLHGPKI